MGYKLRNMQLKTASIKGRKNCFSTLLARGWGGKEIHVSLSHAGVKCLWAILSTSIRPQEGKVVSGGGVNTLRPVCRACCRW